MRTAIDFSSSRPAPAAIKAAGVTVNIRYLTRARGPKCLTRAEAELYWPLGIAVAPNFEDAANNALKGAGQGTADGIFANQLADELDIPAGVWIWYSCDTAATYDQVAPYYRALQELARRPVAFYGPLGVGLQLKAAGFVVGVWCANAASWSGYKTWDSMAAAARATGAHMLQHLDHPLAGIPAQAYDLNEILQPFPTWGAAAPAPTIQEDPVSIICARVASTVPGRAAFVNFDPTSKTLVGYNGAEFSTSADPKSWTVTEWPENPEGITGSAKLLAATDGNLGYGEAPDGTGMVITADGDAGTFAIPYHKITPLPTPVPTPAPSIDLVALAKQVAAHLSLAAK